uniref:Dimethylallyltranstransferase n=3 Tax=Fischerella TaxID=1190 RepID=AMBP2_FISAU|nr:AmbP2 [Fischerella ambigua UTEX 1903]AHI58876.1 FidP2 [Fischerella muscicola UTEX 1829]APZ79589.1 FilE2 [Fischerella sp. TAU]AIJ28561.1 geranyl diphosphate synthase [Fischerella ambigua UTEX 1903]APB62252.1 polyprenyl synthetase [Fischerella ambigua UTEX 1903]
MNESTMNTKNSEQAILNSEYYETQEISHEIKTVNASVQSSILKDTNTYLTEATFNLPDYLAQRREKVEAALESSITSGYPEKLYKSMRYSLMAGGKRLRPILCLASCELSGGVLEMAMPTACALEMLHTMSLMHDDLPALDNDDYRRGKLTNHKVYGENIAILAGDALLPYAFEYIVVQTKGVPADRLLRVIGQLSHAVGAAGLAGGQVADLESEKLQNIDLATLNFIHSHKTGALLEACVVSGALLVGANDEVLWRLSRYARNVGLAFQIIDDVLDVIATKEQLGKTPGKDEKAQKATYPSLLGINESRYQAQKLIEEAKKELAPFEEKAIPLISLADYIITRTH